MNRTSQRPRQIDLNKILIKYDNWEEFSKIDTTFDAQDNPIVIDKVVLISENPSNVHLKKKEIVSKEKKSEVLINKPEIRFFQSL